MHRIIFIGDIAYRSRKRSEKSQRKEAPIPLTIMGSPQTNAIMEQWLQESNNDQWSPTKEDFDKLIEEQECFEISWRDERKKNTELEKENLRLKHALNKEKKDRLRFEQESKNAQTKVANLEQKLSDLEKQVAEQQAEIEQLKTANSLFIKAGGATACQKHSDLNNNASAGDTLDTNQATETNKSNDGRRNRRSLVSQLIQGFEAVTNSQTLKTTTTRSRDLPRRKTFPGNWQESKKAAEENKD